MVLSDGIIQLDKDEVLKLCKLGQEADTCIWLMVGSGGFECRYYSRPTALEERWKRGLTVAKRDGCKEVRGLNQEVKRVEAATLQDVMDGRGLRK